MKRPTWYAGKDRGTHVWSVLKWTNPNPPTQADFPNHSVLIGPHRTRKGALFMCSNGILNPHCRTAADADRLAKTWTVDK